MTGRVILQWGSIYNVTSDQYTIGIENEGHIENPPLRETSRYLTKSYSKNTYINKNFKKCRVRTQSRHQNIE